MPEYIQREFPLGWIPSDNEINGRKEGLLRIDGCELTDRGIVRGIRYFTQESSAAFFTNIHSLYSKTLNLNTLDVTYPSNAKVRYAYGADGTLRRNYGPVSKSLTVFENAFIGANASHCYFLSALGKIICIAGDKKFMDSGILPVRQIGIPAPVSAPLVGTVSPGVLNGRHFYRQVNVYNTGSFAMVGLNGPVSSLINFVDENGSITPVAPVAPADEVRIYRSSDEQASWLLVKVLTGAFGVFVDDVTDEEAEMLTLSSLGYEFEPFRSELPNNIIGMVWIGNRVVYCTTQGVLPSYVQDFGSYDSRYVYDIGSIFGNVCYFIAKVSEGQFFVGTNTDLYSFTGDFSPITVAEGIEVQDITVRPMGIKKPPVNEAHFVENGSLYYLAEDGWRILAGNTTGLMSQELLPLYNNEIRADFPPVSRRALSNNVSTLSCTKSKGRFYASMEHDTLDRVMHIYDETLKYWTNWRSDTFRVLTIFAEDDGTVIGAGVSGAANFLCEMFRGDFPGGSFPIMVRTTFNDLGSPNQRKDIEDLTICVDTTATNYNLVIRWFDVAGAIQSITQVINTTGYEELRPLSTTLAAIQLNKIYQIEINSTTGNSNFEFFGYKVSYKLRPPQRSFFQMAQTNLGDPRRKRINTWPIVIDTLGFTVEMNPRFDGADQGAQLFTSTEPRTLFYFFTTDATATDVGFKISGLAGGLFELYEPIHPPNITEYFPIKAKYFEISQNNLGEPKRKRINTWPFKIISFGNPTTVTPRFDGFSEPGGVLHSSQEPKTINYYFTGDKTPVDVGYKVSGVEPFELYEPIPPSVTEVFPIKAKFFKSSENNYNSPSRKRAATWPFRLTTFGTIVTVRPETDGIFGPILSLTTVGTEPSSENYYYTQDTLGVDWGFELVGNEPFELFPNPGPKFLKEFPLKAKFTRIDDSDYGSPVDKEVNTLPIEIDTFGKNVSFSPTIDLVAQMTATLNTISQKVVNYYYTDLRTGVSHGFVFSGVDPFELYGPKNPNFTFTYPQKQKYLNLPKSNFGLASKKRIRTWPWRVNTQGGSVLFTPSADGVSQGGQIFVGQGNETEFYLFSQDVFAVDYSAFFSSSIPFQVLESQLSASAGGGLNSGSVENLPVPKVFDQLGPIELYKKGVVKSFKFRMIPTGTSLNYTIYDHDQLVISGSIATVPNEHNYYEVIIPFNDCDMRVIRIELSGFSVFYRTGSWIKAQALGDETQYSYIEVK